MKEPFLNEDRTRYYGLRVGDTVESKRIGGRVIKGEVVELIPFDNNRVAVKTDNGIVELVAEWCTIIEKVENKSIVRRNLINKPGYRPYCGSDSCKVMPRSVYKDGQFHCPVCGWVSQFPDDFIAEYKKKWNITT